MSSIQTEIKNLQKKFIRIAKEKEKVKKDLEEQINDAILKWKTGGTQWGENSFSI